MPEEDNAGILSLISAIEQTDSSGVKKQKNGAFCLICQLCPPNVESAASAANIFLQSDLKSVLERVTKRRIRRDKFDSCIVCGICVSKLNSFAKLEAELLQLSEEISESFAKTNPVNKRGRKRKAENVQQQQEEKVEGVRKSVRSRRPKFAEIFVTEDVASFSDNEDKSPRVKRKTSKVHSSMATNCPHCSFSSDSGIQVERHVKKVHSDEKPFACELCGKSFFLKSNLTSHTKSHTLEKPFNCDKCEKSFKQRHSLREHVLRSHDNIKKYLCPFCQEKFSSRHLLRAHERSHTGEKGFICDECGEEFATKQALNYHQSKHSGQYAMRCQVCQRGFNNKTLFHEHTLIHTGEKPFQCDQCNKKFANRGSFWIHKKQHDNAKPYPCTFCNKKFSHSSHLAVHKRGHTGERPYKCRFCTRGFVSANHLRRHMKNHTGQLPFGCQQCSQDFKLKSQLIQHSNQEHNGIVMLQRGQEEEEEQQLGSRIVVDTSSLIQNNLDQLESSTTHYVIQDDKPEQETADTQTYRIQESAVGEDQEYTVVNISDVSAYQNEHTVIEESVTEVLSTTHNEDGTTTYMVTANTDESGGQEMAGKTVLLVRLPQGFEQQ